MTAANKVTIGRIFLAPLFLLLIILYQRDGHEALRAGAILCFGIAAAADAVDGYLARHYNQRTTLGATLDPLADKLLLVSAVSALSLDSHGRLDRLPIWLLAVMLTRECLLLAGMVMLHGKWGKLEARPRLAGKVATVLQMTVVLWIMLRFPSPPLPYLTAAAGLFVVMAGLYYAGDFLRLWRSGVGREAKNIS